jgi:peptidoglycan hydrolase CwlO-like protein
MKVQTRNIENDVNFMMAGVENVDEIKEGYDARVKSLETDIELLKKKIE